MRKTALDLRPKGRCPMMVLVEVSKTWSNDFNRVVQEDYRVTHRFATPEEMARDLGWEDEPSPDAMAWYRIFWAKTDLEGWSILSRAEYGLPEMRLIDADWPLGLVVHRHLEPVGHCSHPAPR